MLVLRGVLGTGGVGQGATKMWTRLLLLLSGSSFLMPVCLFCVSRHCWSCFL